MFLSQPSSCAFLIYHSHPMVQEMQNKNNKQRMDGLARALENQVIFHKAILTINEASRYLGLTKKHLNELIRLKVVPFHLRGGHIYFKRTELEGWIVNDGHSGALSTVIKFVAKLLPWLSVVTKFVSYTDN